MTWLQRLRVLLRVHARLGHSLRASCHCSALVAMGVLVSCARSGLDPGELAVNGEPTPPPTATPTGTPPSPSSMSPVDAGSPSANDAGLASGGSVGAPACAPATEQCNGRDDDCNGVVDDMPPIACAAGGFSYCVAGRQSACPSRCETCIPGSERVCFTSYCTFWGTQTCTADGRSFGSCRERRVPSECAGAAGRDGDIAKLEQCCIAHGYCCVDSEDLDHDGDRAEVLGNCEDVSCD